MHPKSQSPGKHRGFANQTAASGSQGELLLKSYLSAASRLWAGCWPAGTQALLQSAQLMCREGKMRAIKRAPFWRQKQLYLGAEVLDREM